MKQAYRPRQQSIVCFCIPTTNVANTCFLKLCNCRKVQKEIGMTLMDFIAFSMKIRSMMGLDVMSFLSWSLATLFILQAVAILCNYLFYCR